MAGLHEIRRELALRRNALLKCIIAELEVHIYEGAASDMDAHFSALADQACRRLVQGCSVSISLSLEVTGTSDFVHSPVARPLRHLIVCGAGFCDDFQGYFVAS